MSREKREKHAPKVVVFVLPAKLYSPYSQERRMEEEMHEFLQRSDEFVLMDADHECFSCGVPMSVVGVLLPSNYEEMSIEEEPEDDEWGVFGLPCIVRWISSISPEALHIIKERYPLFDIHESKFGDRVYMNRCPNCRKFQEDEELHHIGNTLAPIDEKEMDAIRLIRVREKISLNGSSSWGTVADALSERLDF